LTALFLWTVQSGNDQNTDTLREDAEERDEEHEKRRKPGFRLDFDLVRRFAEPLGIQLEDWEDRMIEIEDGVVRLLPVTERAKQLFGNKDARTAASQLAKQAQDDAWTVVFSTRKKKAPRTTGRASGKARPAESAANDAVTTLDRVHAAMLLQANEQVDGLRALLKAERERGPDFLRLANALSGLYPKDSEEKRLLDAMWLSADGSSK
jgi:hypothetical protein